MPTIEEVASRAEVVVTTTYTPDEPLITTHNGRETTHNGREAIVAPARVVWTWTEDRGKWWSHVKIRGFWRLKSGEWSETPRYLYLEPGVAEYRDAAIEATRPTWTPVFTREEVGA